MPRILNNGICSRVIIPIRRALPTDNWCFAHRRDSESGCRGRADRGCRARRYRSSIWQALGKVRLWRFSPVPVPSDRSATAARPAVLYGRVRVPTRLASHPLYCGIVRPASEAFRSVALSHRTVEYVCGPLSRQTLHLHGLPAPRYDRTGSKAGSCAPVTHRGEGLNSVSDL